jgi:hypothetical protein
MMKPRPNGFLSDENIDHNEEIFDYIKELHEYLWKFVYIANPGAGGNLSDFVDDALAKLAAARLDGERTGYVKALDDSVNKAERLLKDAKEVKDNQVPIDRLNYVLYFLQASKQDCLACPKENENGSKTY